jgi:hypothetical protein
MPPGPFGPRALLCAALCLSAGCAQAPAARGDNWPEADELFRHDPLWLGSDGDYSCDLGNGRVLWLFGDTLIARDATRNRNTAFFIHNTLGVQTGYDPSRASIHFYWGGTSDQPDGFFPEQGAQWFWPGGCARVGSGLIVFAGRVVQHGAPGPLSFAGAGDDAFFIDNPDDEPSAWHPRETQPPSFGAGLSLGTAVMINGDYLYAYGLRDGDAHNYVVIRFSLSDAVVGDLSHGEFFTAGRWMSATGMTNPPDAIFDLGAPESSVSWVPSLGRYLMTASEGVLATTIAFRSAPTPQGPWTEPRTFFRPPESYLPNAAVYAAKGHPELIGADYIATYYPGTIDGNERPQIPGDDYARFVKVTFQ